MAKPVYGFQDAPTFTEANEFFVNSNFVRKNNVESKVSNTTLGTDLELSVPVVANAMYMVRLIMILSSAVDTGDIKVLFRTPASATFQGMGTTLIASATSQTQTQNLPYGGNASESWGVLAGGTSYGMVNGMLVTAGTAGTLSIEWAQNTSVGSQTSVNAGSNLWLYRVS